MDNVVFARKPRLLDVAAPAEAQRTRSLGLGYKLCAVMPVASQRTHGTTFRALKVTFQVCGNNGGGVYGLCLHHMHIRVICLVVDRH